MIRIGLSARFMSQSPNEFGIGGKAIQYLEQSMANSLARAGSLVFLIPSIGTTTELSTDFFKPKMYAEAMDGLVLQGGVDISPSLYGETPISPEIETDALRDQYELALIDAFLKLGKPVLGICRGMQLINVYCGGSLYQDIPTHVGHQTTHYCPTSRERILHEIKLAPGGYLARLYENGGDSLRHMVNSIHHQSVKALGRQLKAEAVSPNDGVIEAIRLESDTYLVGVQWHPEFHYKEPGTTLDADVLFRDFFNEALKSRQERREQEPLSLLPRAGSL